MRRLRRTVTVVSGVLVAIACSAGVASAAVVDGKIQKDPAGTDYSGAVRLTGSAFDRTDIDPVFDPGQAVAVVVGSSGESGSCSQGTADAELDPLGASGPQTGSLFNSTLSVFGEPEIDPSSEFCSANVGSANQAKVALSPATVTGDVFAETGSPRDRDGKMVLDQAVTVTFELYNSGVPVTPDVGTGVAKCVYDTPAGAEADLYNSGVGTPNPTAPSTGSDGVIVLDRINGTRNNTLSNYNPCPSSGFLYLEAVARANDGSNSLVKVVPR